MKHTPITDAKKAKLHPPGRKPDHARPRAPALPAVRAEAKALGPR